MSLDKERKMVWKSESVKYNDKGNSVVGIMETGYMHVFAFNIKRQFPQRQISNFRGKKFSLFFSFFFFCCDNMIFGWPHLFAWPVIFHLARSRQVCNNCDHSIEKVRRVKLPWKLSILIFFIMNLVNEQSSVAAPFLCCSFWFDQFIVCILWVCVCLCVWLFWYSLRALRVNLITIFDRVSRKFLMVVILIRFFQFKLEVFFCTWFQCIIIFKGNIMPSIIVAQNFKGGKFSWLKRLGGWLHWHDGCKLCTLLNCNCRQLHVNR